MTFTIRGQELEPGTFTVRDAEPFTVRATSIETAAGVAARKLHGRKASVMRTTGSVGLSGYFQAYLPYQQAHTSVGFAFHVSDA